MIEIIMKELEPVESGDYRCTPVTGHIKVAGNNHLVRSQLAGAFKALIKQHADLFTDALSDAVEELEEEHKDNSDLREMLKCLSDEELDGLLEKIRSDLRDERKNL